MFAEDRVLVGVINRKRDLETDPALGRIDVDRPNPVPSKSVPTGMPFS